MKDEFKAGGLVFELNFHRGIGLVVLQKDLNQDGEFQEFYTRYGFNYSQCGRANPSFKVPHLLHATPENRQALVTLYGEDAVPELPLRGSELTKKLLEKQKYVLCVVSHISDDKARSNNPPKVRTVVGVDRDWFESVTGLMNQYAVPIDNNGDEITEIESC